MRVKFQKAALKRLAEPSTWGGLGVILGGFGMSSEGISRTILIITSIAALVAQIVMPEGTAESSSGQPPVFDEASGD